MKKPDTGALQKLIKQGSRKAQSIGAEVLISHAQEIDGIDPLDLFSAAEAVTSDRWYWENPDEDRAVASVGIMSGMTPPRNVRFQEVDRLIRQYASTATVASETGSGQGSPRFSIGFSFDPRHTQDRLVWQGYPSTYLLTPRLTVVRDGGSCILTQNVFVGAKSDPDKLSTAADEFNQELVNAFHNQKDSNLVIDEIAPDNTNEKEIRQFVRAIARAESAIQRGDFEVLSIARRRKMTTGGLYRLNRALKYLRGRFPQSTIVASGRHGSTFIGYATDTLLKKSGASVSTSTTAGSIRRGDSSELDEALASQLMNNPDEVEHHELCVDHRYETFEAHCQDVEASDEPSIRSTTERHQLYSTVTGELQSGSSMMDLLGDLHPVVDSSGMPNTSAFDFIYEEGQTDRGWFSAPFGWMDIEGNGEFISASNAVVVRSPVLGQQRAYLFSRSPVFSGADPDDLLAKTDDQMNALRVALTQ